MKITLPDGQYLQKIGTLVFLVAELEGMLIYDLPRYSSLLPPELNFFTEGKRVTTMTTHNLGEYLVAHAKNSSDPKVAAYFQAGGDALVRIGPARNAVLHARPGHDLTDPQKKLRLVRWAEFTNKEPERHMISDEWLDSLIGQIGILRMQVIALRPPPPPVEDQGPQDETPDSSDEA